MYDLFKIPGGQNRLQAATVWFPDEVKNNPEFVQSLLAETPMEMQQAGRAGLYNQQAIDARELRPYKTALYKGQALLYNEQAGRWRMIAPAEMARLQALTGLYQRTQSLTDSRIRGQDIENQYRGPLMQSQIGINQSRAMDLSAFPPGVQESYGKLFQQAGKLRMAEAALMEKYRQAVATEGAPLQKGESFRQRAAKALSAIELTRAALRETLKQMAPMEQQIKRYRAQTGTAWQSGPLPSGVQLSPLPMPDVPNPITGPNHYGPYPQG